MCSPKQKHMYGLYKFVKNDYVSLECKSQWDSKNEVFSIWQDLPVYAPTGDSVDGGIGLRYLLLERFYILDR